VDALFIVAMQIVVTWLYNSTRGSVLILMVLHFMQNIGGGFFNPAFSGGDAVDYAWLRAALYATIATGVIAWAGLRICHEGPW
jgi:membrane protease YdiL (CAAX protease family)